MITKFIIHDKHMIYPFSNEYVIYNLNDTY